MFKIMLLVPLYLLVTVIIFAVLSRLADKFRWRGRNVEAIILTASILWPAWGELAIGCIVCYILYKICTSFAEFQKNQVGSAD